MTSEKTLLFIHGFPLAARMWHAAQDEIKSLAASKNVAIKTHAITLRGFGGEAAEFADEHAEKNSPQIRTMRDFADEVLRFCENQSLGEKQLVLCGLSMGGYVAMEFAKRYSSFLAGMILCDTKATADAQEVAETRRKLADELEAGTKTLADVAQGMLPKLITESTRTHGGKLLQEIEDILTQHNPRGIAAAARGMAQREDSRDFLAALDLPTLILCGDQDAISPPEEMRALAESMRQSKFAVIPNSGHMSPCENPAAFAREIVAFLESVE